MATINEINQTILSGQLSYDQLSSIAMALKLARTQLGQKAKTKFRIGDTVEFGVGARCYTGRVEKIMQKNVLVKTTVGVTYRVPALMLKAA